MLMQEVGLGIDQLRESLLRGDLVQDVRRLLQSGAADHGRWIRENVRHALSARREDPGAVAALTGLSAGTVRGFLNGRPSSIDNVLLIAEAVGYTLAKLDRPPEQFRQDVKDRGDGAEGGAIGASLLAFDESPIAMAIVLLDDTIVKVNRRLLGLLGYDEGELVGAPAATLSISTEADRAAQFEELLASGVTHRRVVQLRRKDGSLISAIGSAMVARDDRGEPRYVIARAAPVEPGAKGQGATAPDPSA
jgi:PAS domain S-box-containing protein